MHKKTKILLFLFICSAFLIASCGRDVSDEARAYNDQIVSMQNGLTMEVDTFLQSINDPEANTVILYQSAQKSVQSVTEKLKSVKQFEGGTALFIETQNYIKVCHSALNDEGAKIVELKAKLSIHYNSIDLAAINQYSNSFYLKVRTAAVKFDKTQLDFAKKYHFDIKTSGTK